MKLSVATTNPGKLREFRLAADGRFEIEPIPIVAAPEETGTTFEENARLKAAYYSRGVDGPLFAEDSGLEVDALHGAPGVYSARFSPSGDDGENNRLLIQRLRGETNRKARYVCAIALAERGHVLATFRGEVDGEIVDDARGNGGFGYDPHFFYPPFQATFAEVAAERKFEVSHRRRALDAMFTWLRNFPQTSST